MSTGQLTQRLALGERGWVVIRAVGGLDNVQGALCNYMRWVRLVVSAGDA